LSQSFVRGLSAEADAIQGSQMEVEQVLELAEVEVPANPPSSHYPQMKAEANLLAALEVFAAIAKRMSFVSVRNTLHLLKVPLARRPQR
jgi:hypothetical protein